MTMTDVVDAPRTRIAGAQVIAGIRRLVMVAALSAFGSTLLTVASKGGCSEQASVIDGEPPVVACTTMALRPGPFLPVLVAVAVVWALGHVLRTIGDEDRAVRFLARTSTVIAIVAAIGVAVSLLWFFLTPVPESLSYTIVSPFPFGTIDVNADLDPTRPG